MPLETKKYSHLYFDFLESDDIIDEILYGQKEYPVVDLCKTREFDYAAILLQKGYRCLHDDMAHETLAILNATQPSKHFCSNGADKITYILDKLSEEINHLNKSELQMLVQNCKYTIIKSPMIYADLLPFICDNLPALYQTFLQLSDWNIEELLLTNVTFVNDYLENLMIEERLEEFIYSYKLNEKDATILLSKLLTPDYLDGLDSHEKILYRIGLNCPGIFPTNFTCDVAILTSIGKLRTIVYELDEFEPGPDTEEFTTNKGFQSFMGRLNRLLRFHMKEAFSLERVSQALINSCGIDGTIFDLDPKEIPQICDYYILDAVAAFAKQQFNIHKLSISFDTLKNTLNNWENIHHQADWKHNYLRAKRQIQKLVNWFCTNCNIKVSANVLFR